MKTGYSEKTQVVRIDESENSTKSNNNKALVEHNILPEMTKWCEDIC